MHLACFTNNHTKFQSQIRGVCRRIGPVARYQEGHWEKAPESKLVVTARWVDCWPCFEATQWKTRLLYFRLVLATGHKGQHRSSADAGQVWGGVGAHFVAPRIHPLGMLWDQLAQENLMIEVIKCLGAELRGDAAMTLLLLFLRWVDHNFRSPLGI